MIPPEIVGPATLAITQGVSVFGQFLPPLTEVRKRNAADTEFAADVRLGEVAAAGLVIGIGAIASSLTHSTIPIVVATITALGLIFLYESTLRANRPFEERNV